MSIRKICYDGANSIAGKSFTAVADLSVYKKLTIEIKLVKELLFIECKSTWYL